MWGVGRRRKWRNLGPVLLLFSQLSMVTLSFEVKRKGGRDTFEEEGKDMNPLDQRQPEEKYLGKFAHQRSVGLNIKLNHTNDDFSTHLLQG